jgi:hypothetical protein
MNKPIGPPRTARGPDPLFESINWDIRQLVKDAGGPMAVAAVAKQLGSPLSLKAVYSWVERDRAPLTAVAFLLLLIYGKRRDQGAMRGLGRYLRLPDV